MQTLQSSLLARDDTMFGICEALGEDFGFNPNYLRLALALGVLFSPMGAIAAYVAMAPVVLLSRWLAPDPRRPVAPETVEMQAPATQEVEPEPERLPLAA